MKYELHDLDGVYHEVSRQRYIYIQLVTAAGLIRTSYFAHVDYKFVILDAAEISLTKARKAMITSV